MAWPVTSIVSTLYTPRLCPICNGNPTRVSAASLAKLCQRYKGSCSSCATCTPESLPEELTIIDQPLEESMGERKTVYQACELCGDMKNTKTNNGKMVCCNCEPVWRMVNHNPDNVFGMLSNKHGFSWFLGKLPAGGELLQENEEWAKESDVDAKEIISLRESLAVAELARDTLAHQLNCSREDLTVAYERIQELQGELHTAREAYKSLLSGYDAAKASSCNLSCKNPTRDTAVLNIALQVIAGEITGISAADLAALR
jgi:hypothetical protein